MGESELTGCSVLLHIRLPVLSGLVRVVVQLWRPRALHDVLGASTLHNDLVAESASLSQDLEIQRVCQVVAVNDGVLKRILRLQGHGSAGPRREELRNDREGVLAVDWEPIILLGATVAFRGEELNVWLLGSKTHGVSARLPGSLLPKLRVLQAVVESGKGESAEWESGEESGLVLFPLLIGLGQGVTVIYKVVVRQARFVGFIENEDDLSGNAWSKQEQGLLCCR